MLQAGATQVFTISNMSTVWVLANVYQHDLGFVHTGDAVEVQTDAYPDTFHGKISFISPALDPTSRTLQVRIVTDNPGEKLKKDMYCTAIVRPASLKTLSPCRTPPYLRTAENEPFVYVAATGPSRINSASGWFRSARARAADANHERAPAGENVAANGSLFLQFANSFHARPRP